MRSRHNAIRYSLMLVLGTSLGACALDDDPRNADFGQSVRRTVALQTAEPNRGARGMDGDKAAATIRSYRDRGDAGEDAGVSGIGFDQGR